MNQLMAPWTGVCLTRTAAVLLALWSLSGEPAVGQGTGKLIYSNSLSGLDQSRWRMLGGELSSSSGAVRLSGERGPRAMLAGVQLTDFEVQVEIKPENNTQAGVVFGLVIRRKGWMHTVVITLVCMLTPIA